MPKFETNPNTKMTGSIVMAVLESVNYENYRHIVDPIFEQHGYSDIDPESLYPAQLLLDMYRVMDDKSYTMFDFMTIGQTVAANLEFSESVKTIADAILGLNKMYEFMLSDFDESEMYQVDQVADNHIRVRDNNPYPHDMVYGYIHKLTQRFKPEGTAPIVKRTYDNPDDPNSGGATYDITW